MKPQRPSSAIPRLKGGAVGRVGAGSKPGLKLSPVEVPVSWIPVQGSDWMKVEGSERSNALRFFDIPLERYHGRALRGLIPD